MASSDWLDAYPVGHPWRQIARRVGKRYAGCRLANFEVQSESQKPVLAALTRYAEAMESGLECPGSIVLFGPCGVGKDHLLVGMMAVAVKAGRFVEWQNGEELYGTFRDAMDSGTSESELLLGLTKPDVLAISDPVPPWGSLSEWQARTLFRVLDARYRDERPTWISLNASSGKEASERMTHQVVDRLRHGGLSLHCDWPSYRR